MRSINALAGVLFILLLASYAIAEVPQIISYQGRLTDAGGDPQTGSFNMLFRIYDDSTDGTILWQEPHSDINGNPVEVEDGLFNVLLGEGFPIPDSILNDVYRWLSIKIGADPEITPRTRLLSTPYAFSSSHCDTARFSDNANFADTADFAYSIEDGSVTESKLVDNAVTTPKITNDAITSVKISNGTMLFEDIGQNGAISGEVIKWDGIQWGTDQDNSGDNDWTISSSDIFSANSGSVGIGTSSPGYKLHVNGSSYASTINTGFGNNELYAMNQYVRSSDNATFNRVHITDYGIAMDGFHVGGTSNPGTDNLVVDGKVTIGSSGSNYKLQINSNTNTDVGLSLQYYTGENNSPSPYLMLSAGVYRNGGYPGAALRAVNDIDATWGKKALAFYTRDNNSEDFGINQYHERMRIGSNGRVGIGTTNPAWTLDVQGSIGGTGGLYHSSDERLKKNITTITGALQKVTKLRGVCFDWRTNDFPEKNFPQGRHIGVIAQEVEEVIPELVATMTNGYKSIEYSNMVAVLIEAIKEQQTEIAELKTLVKQCLDQNR